MAGRWDGCVGEENLMAVEVACQCGKRFAAQPHLMGKTVKCPVCGQPITIPSSEAVPNQAACVVACQCGQRFRAQPHLAGKQVGCPKCGRTIQVPGQEAPVVADVIPDELASVDDGFSYGVSEPVALAPEIRGAAARALSNRSASGRAEPMPDSAQMACGALAGLGALMMVLVIGIHSISGPGDIDEFGQNLSAVIICLAIAAMVSALMVWLRAPLAQVAGGLVALCVLLFFPIGTIFSLFILFKLLDEETVRYLRR